MGSEELEKKVGRYENVSFPELNIDKIKGKIDTGAYGIALHVDDIEVDITSNSYTSLSAAALIEACDRLIGFNHLFGKAFYIHTLAVYFGA